MNQTCCLETISNFNILFNNHHCDKSIKINTSVKSGSLFNSIF